MEHRENPKIASKYSNHLPGNFNRKTMQNLILNPHSPSGLVPALSIASLRKTVQPISMSSGCIIPWLIARPVICDFFHKGVISAETSLLYF
jgi:hypothetical protein